MILLPASAVVVALVGRGHLFFSDKGEAGRKAKVVDVTWPLEACPLALIDYFPLLLSLWHNSRRFCVTRLAHVTWEGFAKTGLFISLGLSRSEK